MGVPAEAAEGTVLYEAARDTLATLAEASEFARALPAVDTVLFLRERWCCPGAKFQPFLLPNGDLRQSHERCGNRSGNSRRHRHVMTKLPLTRLVDEHDIPHIEHEYKANQIC